MLFKVIPAFIYTMAVASQVHLSLEHAGICHTPNIRLESAEIGSQVLQENHERYDFPS